jgi:WD40 repeat protein
VRLWSIKSKKLVNWNQIPDETVTALSFTQNGSVLVAGTLKGNLVFFEVDGLKSSTQISITKNESKITGISFMPFAADNEEKLLISSADSRIRIINVRDKSLYRVYKGLELKNGGSFATFSYYGEFIIAAGEDRYVTIWDVNPIDLNVQYKGVMSGIMYRQDNIKSSENIKFLGSHSYITSAIIYEDAHSLREIDYIIVADVQGFINIYENKV